MKNAHGGTNEFCSWRAPQRFLFPAFLYSSCRVRAARFRSSVFQGEDIYTISDNVGPLLSGMKVAFHTSVYGILFSLIFNFVYRSIMADVPEMAELK